MYSDSQDTDANGNFNFELWDVFDLQRGQVVTVSDGTTTKTHTVTPLYVDGVDITDITISGRADAGTTVDVWVHENGNLTVTADGSGNWIADFSGQTDLTYATMVVRDSTMTMAIPPECGGPAPGSRSRRMMIGYNHGTGGHRERPSH